MLTFSDRVSEKTFIAKCELHSFRINRYHTNYAKFLFPCSFANNKAHVGLELTFSKKIPL